MGAATRRAIAVNHVELQQNADLAMIGSGGAATAAAITARQAGATVVLIEHGVLGGGFLDENHCSQTRCPPPAVREDRTTDGDRDA